MDAVAVKNLSFSYPEGEKKVLDGISFTVKSGELVTLCGLSGSGKSTLLRHLKPALTPNGERSGEMFIGGRDISSLSLREQSAEIGFVMQSPDNQIVTDRVWHELSFGLENLGVKKDEIRRRTAETAAFFGIQHLYGESVSHLSGGQKQLLNLASVMVMQPGLLILDEPTSQLDPIAAADFLAFVTKINRELGTAVIITEHRLEDILPASDRVLVIENGRIISDDIPANTGKNLKKAHSGCFFSMPAPMRIWDAAGSGEEACPVTLSQGREWLRSFSEKNTLYPLYDEEIPEAGESAVSLKNIWFRYEKNSADVIKDLSLEVKRGECLAVMGGNGTGKSTLISLINGTNKPYSGKVISNNELCLTMPQNPEVLLDGKTLLECLEETAKASSVSAEERDKRLKEVIRLCGLSGLLSRHPFDLSGGEKQKAALAKLLLRKPSILLLDEPTKGLDAKFKEQLGGMIRRLVQNGAAVVMISHDMEFCAKFSHRCLLMFNGETVAGGTPREFFGSNSFYVTAPARMSKGMIDGAVTAEDVIFCCTGKRQEPPEPDDFEFDDKIIIPQPNKKPKIPLYKKLFASIGALLLLFGILENLNVLPFINPGELPLWANALFIIVPTVLLMVAAGAKTKPSASLSFERRKAGKRTVAALLIILLLIPLTIAFGIIFLQDQKYLFISLLIIIEAMVPFLLIFEGRKPQARELVLIAVLCALAAASRTAFAAFPQIKPVLALVIICGAAFGGETGFVIGAASMLVSNIYFGQGAWTPWQMFAAGMTGFLSGLIFGNGIIRTDKAAFSIYGFLVTVLLYGSIMNFSSLIMSRTPVNAETVLFFMAQGLPFDIIHAFSTAAFLFFFANPMLEKLGRIKTKYGLIE